LTPDRLEVTNSAGISFIGENGIAINDLSSDLNIMGDLRCDISVHRWNGRMLSILGSRAAPDLAVPNGYVKKQKDYLREGTSYYDIRYMPENAAIFTGVRVRVEPEIGSDAREVVEVTGEAYSLQDDTILCCALYAADGRLLSLELVRIPCSQDVQEWTAALEKHADGREVRVLMFDESLAPVMEMFSASLPAA
jgi:hypothetical protein